MSHKPCLLVQFQLYGDRRSNHLTGTGVGVWEVHEEAGDLAMKTFNKVFLTFPKYLLTIASNEHLL